MSKEKILNILESVLGEGKKQTKGEYLFYCPSCHHHKPKLIVKIDSAYDKFQFWHCWICGSSGTRGRTLYSLLKRFKASPKLIQEMNKIVGKQNYVRIKTDEAEKIVQLPRGYKPLWGDDLSIQKRHALVALKNRGIFERDILRYQIGYCESGDYANMIIIPSYGDDGLLNYFIARSYFKDAYIKYKNPEVSRNIVAFDMFINWQLPIVLVEGAFDAIATRRNAIPLLGKTMSDKLYEKILVRRPPAVYIALDDDAVRDAVVIADKLIKEQISTHIINFDEKDPSDLGFEKMIQAYNKSPLLDEGKLFYLKMANNVK